MIEPCFGMDGHPRARMNTILRRCEAEIKIFNSRWFPASIYRSKWSNIAGQGSNMKKSSKKSIFEFFFGICLSIQGVERAIREGPERIPELKNDQRCMFFKFVFGFFYRSRGSRGPSGRVQNRSQSLKTIKYIDFSTITKNR